MATATARRPSASSYRDSVQLLHSRLVLCDLPRLRLLDMPVQPADDVPDRIERPGEVVLVELSRNVVADSHDGVRDHARALGRGDQLSVSRPCNQRSRPREQISEIVAELTLVPLVELLDGGVPVLTEPRRPKQVVPQRVGSVDVDQVERLDDVAERLRDLLLVDREVPVDEELLRTG